MLTRLTELIETHNVFVRERKPNWPRSLGIALLFHGLSCRKTAEVLMHKKFCKSTAAFSEFKTTYFRLKTRVGLFLINATVLFEIPFTNEIK